MRLFRHVIAALAMGIAAVSMPASAQQPDEDQASINKAYSAIMASMPRDGDLIMMPYVSMLGGYGIETEMIADPNVPGHKAMRVVAEKGRNNWEAAVTASVGPAIEKGDLLVMVFYAKIVEGSPELPWNTVGQNAPPFNAVISSPATITDEWDVYVVQGKADKNYKQNSLNVSMQVANADHTIDFGPVFLINLK